VTFDAYKMGLQADGESTLYYNNDNNDESKKRVKIVSGKIKKVDKRFLVRPACNNDDENDRSGRNDDDSINSDNDSCDSDNESCDSYEPNDIPTHAQPTDISADVHPTLAHVLLNKQSTDVKIRYANSNTGSNSN
jgi:hypothetical protein